MGTVETLSTSGELVPSVTSGMKVAGIERMVAAVGPPLIGIAVGIWLLRKAYGAIFKGENPLGSKK